MPNKNHRLRVKLLRLLVCLVVLTSAVPVSAPVAQSLVYDVGVDFPEFVVLWYWDRMDLALTATQVTDAFFGGNQSNHGSQPVFGSMSGGAVEVDAGMGDVVDDNNLVGDPPSMGCPLGVGLRVHPGFHHDQEVRAPSRAKTRSRPRTP
jgi:hypothetical protein